MSKTLKIVIVSFFTFLLFSILVYCVANIQKSIEEKNNKVVIVDEGVIVDINNISNTGKWYDITEEDKITLALTSETSIISTLKEYLKDNKIAIFYVYGGPFDHNLIGNYIICTGFNADGKAKILYPDDNFTTEWIYSYEGLIEFSSKVMMFEM